MSTDTASRSTEPSTYSVTAEVVIAASKVRILRVTMEDIAGKARLAAKVLEGERQNISEAFTLLALEAEKAVYDFDAEVGCVGRTMRRS